MPEPAAIALYTAAQVRELDRLAIEQQGIPAYELMCRAGQALAGSVARHWPQATRVCVLCGAGNNGGDGYVLARCLREAGIEVQVRVLAEPAGLHGAAAQAAQDYLDTGGSVESFDGDLPDSVDLLVDALLGTGLDRPVAGGYLQAIEAMNRHPAPVLAADIPSGLHADSGRVLGAAVEAQCTVTFIGRKRGLYTAAGVQYAGTIEVDELGVPPALFGGVSGDVELAVAPLRAWLAQPRRRDAHKGDFGHLLVVGGDLGMAGAARMAAETALRCGAGLVSVATREAHAAALNAGRPELMVHAVAGSAELAPLLARASVVVVGPGLGQSAWSQQLLERVLASRLPLVVDADALRLLARDPLRRDNWILTPHPGEAAGLLGVTAEDIQADRFAAARRLAEEYGGVAVLKGAGTLIAAPGQALRLCTRGNPGMASAGMGDVLSGVIGALRAQRVGAEEAASAGVCLHATAADRVAAESGERGLLATDLLPYLRALLNARD